MLYNFIINMEKYIGYFIFFYPLMASCIWSIGGLVYWFLYEKEEKPKPKNSTFSPKITILVPCYNEEKTIYKIMDNLNNINYPNYIVIFINDGSKDNTASTIKDLIINVPNFYFLNFTENGGKAKALNRALVYIRTKYVLVLDADTAIDKDALSWLIKPFKDNETIGAVTGNVLLSNKQNYLSRFQAAEFTCIIGLIKRCQHLFGKLFTVSGCITMFNIEALKIAGMFSSQTATEDVDITWRIQRKFYKVLFEPKAIAYIQAPVSFGEYIKQRKRWALGGWHLLKQHRDIFKDSKLRDLWIVYSEFAVSCIWSLLFVLGLISVLIMNIIYFNPQKLVFLTWSTSIMSFVFIIQAAISISINKKYDKELLKYGVWICWYPLVFFLVGTFLVVCTMYKGLFTNSDSIGKWNSPSRL